MNPKTRIPTIACSLALFLNLTPATGQVLQVDLQQTGGTTQGGWNGWDLSGTFGPGAQSNAFTYAETTDGDLDVTLTPGSNAGARAYGLDNVTDPENLAIPDVWADQYFFNNNAGGSLTITLADLKAGSYTFTSYHFADNLVGTPNTNNDEGTANVSVDTGGGPLPTGMDVHFVSGNASQVATTGTGVLASELDEFGTLTFNFTVANDGDPVNIIYGSLSSGDTFGLNGFELDLAGADTTPPQVLSLNPADDATNVATTANLVVTFDEAIQPGSGAITLHETTGDVLVGTYDVPTSPQLSFGTAAVTIDPASDLDPGKEYYVLIDATAIEDLAANAFGGISATTGWSFTTDGTAPMQNGLGPDTAATGVPVDSALALSFDEGVQVGSGNIVLKLLGDDSVVETIDVTSGSVTIVDESFATITPSAPLAPGTSYYVEVDAGAFTDPSGNAFAGISGSSAWTFTTETAAEAAATKVQTTTNGVGTALQDGWALVDGDRNTSPISGTADGITVTVGAEAASFGRSNGADGSPYLAVNHLDGGLDNLLSGGRLINDGLDLILTLSGLADGTYVITTYNHTPYVNQSDGLFTYDVLLTDANGTDVLVHDDLNNSAGETVLSGNLAAPMTSFEVRGGNDVTLAFSPEAGFDIIGGGDQLYLNGFKLLQTGGTQAPTLLISNEGGNLAFQWTSQAMKQYDLLSSTDPAGEPDPANWTAYNDGSTTYEDIPADPGDTNTLSGVLRVGGPRFFALREEDIPPFFAADFEADDGGFTIATPNKGTGTEWAYGMPNSPDLGGGGTTAGNDGSANCWGTNLTGAYATGTDACLRSPVIDLTGMTGATLRFALSLDASASHTYEVNIIEEASDTVIANIIPPTEDDNTLDSAWTTVGPVAIPAAALGQMVRLEWRFTGNGDGNFNGIYIDDVRITTP